jgi:superkiller protein 3
MHAATFYLTHQKDPETAIDHYLRARSDYGIELPNLYANLGTAYLRQAQLNEAQAALEKAVQIKPDYAVALRNLSLAFDRQGRLGEAVRAFIQATEIQRDYLPELKRLGHDLVGHGNIEEAHQVYRALMDLAPDSGFYAELGVMLLEHESVQ